MSFLQLLLASGAVSQYKVPSAVQQTRHPISFSLTALSAVSQYEVPLHSSTNHHGYCEVAFMQKIERSNNHGDCFNWAKAPSTAKRHCVRSTAAEKT